MSSSQRAEATCARRRFALGRSPLRRLSLTHPAGASGSGGPPPPPCARRRAMRLLGVLGRGGGGGGATGADATDESAPLASAEGSEEVAAALGVSGGEAVRCRGRGKRDVDVLVWRSSLPGVETPVFREAQIALQPKSKSE